MANVSSAAIASVKQRLGAIMARTNDWARYHKDLQALEDIENWADYWGDDSPKRPDPEAYNTARRLLNRLEKGNYAIPQYIVPNSEGGVEIVWGLGRGRGVYVEADVCAGRVEWMQELFSDKFEHWEEII